MIDIHFHCLPGIDDGPGNWDDAVALCRAANAKGIDTIVATPHVLRDSWLNEDSDERDSLVRELNHRLNHRPRVLAGCEYYFSADAVELWSQGPRGPLTALNRSSYLLVEFPATRIPEQAEAVFHELAVLHVKPVIAHPERNLVFAENPGRLERFVQLGAAVQITAASLTGGFGKAAEAASNTFIARGLASLVASDAHSLDRRPPLLAEARARVATAWGSDVEIALFETNPSALIANEPLVFVNGDEA